MKRITFTEDDGKLIAKNGIISECDIHRLENKYVEILFDSSFLEEEATMVWFSSIDQATLEEAKNDFIQTVRPA